MTRNTLNITVLALILALSADGARAQFLGRYGYGGLAPGSTVQGDILRGEGVFLAGAGSYLFNEARATSINVDTAIRLNDYLYAIAKKENIENARHRAAVIAKTRENYEKILDRIRNSPEERDMLTGDALNMLRLQLMSPGSESSVRVSRVSLHLPGDTIRVIPFSFNQEGVTFSMRRLVVKGKWPLGFRGPQFSSERRNYEDAVDHALDLLNDGKGKLSRPAVDAVGKAAADLAAKLDRVIRPSRDKVYLDAKAFLRRLESTVNLFKSQKIEQIMYEIDTYHGTTVYELLQFMQRNELKFGVPDEIGDEKELYPRLYAALVSQRDAAGIPAGGGPLK
jgi:hypothetical protein